jgi:hypothetical protein
MKQIALLIIFILLSISGFSQGYPSYDGGLKVNLNDDGSRYFRLILWNQFWARYNENNTGSLSGGVPESSTVDFGLRRSRFLTYAQIDDRFLILAHWGINNQNAISGGLNAADGKKPQLFFHDIWVEYKLFGEKLFIGGGMHYWNGLSRMTSASTLNFMTLDAPIFNWPTIEATDQFARRIGIYAKGRLGKVQYRVAVSDPFETNTTAVIRENVSLYSPQNRNKVVEGYFAFEFFEKEGLKLPYYVGTYLGTKKVFNLGAGFMRNPEAMWHQEAEAVGSDTVFTDMNLFSVDAFLDLPFQGGSKGALTAYAVVYFSDFGPNNVRNIGILNPSDGGGGLRGNAVPTIGTGNTYYIQTGYMLPRKNDKLLFQPYLAFTYHDFEGITDSSGDVVPVTFFDIGGNVYFAGHHSKLTLNYRHRPDFTNPDDLTYRPELTLQAMLYF